MTTVDYNELLYNKMKKEFDSFISELKTKPPEQIIEGSYEKVIKEDLLAIFEYTEFSQTEAKSLYQLKAPLDDIYHITNSLFFHFSSIINVLDRKSVV